MHKVLHPKDYIEYIFQEKGEEDSPESKLCGCINTTTRRLH